MRRISKILATVAIILAPWAVSGTAFAASTCQIGYTGPDSNNMCTSETKFACTVNNNTNIATVTENNQSAVSGTVNLVNNTTSGSGSTGSATNSNGVTFNVTVKNEACTVAAVTPATPTPTPTPAPTTPTGGGAVAPVSKVAATTLPNTSGDVTSGYFVMLASVLGVGALASYLVASLYGRKS
ncbi:MAG: hypothetical protein NTV39_00450 [Candidatus Saccharibacteria bacterium]|nr:hypothetical protein [Candidatus Saccharibacteria bacterium]